MKSRYLAVAFALLMSFLYDDAIFAKKSSKRSGSSQKQSSSKSKKSSSKRSNSSKKNISKSNKSSSKRSVSSKSGLKSNAGSKRAASTNARRANALASINNAKRANVLVAMNSNNAAHVNSSTKSGPVENPCPIGKLLKRGTDENGNDAFFKTKKATCNQPENTNEVAWNMEDPSKLKQYTSKRSWISEEEAVAFECQDGNLLYKGACQSFDDFCPLNEIIEKTKDKKYINPNTGDSCVVAGKAIVKKVQASENDSDIETRSAYRLTCPENFYTNTDNYVQCSACPSDKPYSKFGDNIGIKSCNSVSSAECAEGTWLGNGETACKPYDSYEFSDLAIQDEGTLGYGLYNVISSDDSKCTAGAKNSTFSVKIDETVKFAKVSNNTGSYFAVNGEFVKTCTGNVTFALKQANGSEGLK